MNRFTFFPIMICISLTSCADQASQPAAMSSPGSTTNAVETKTHEVGYRPGDERFTSPDPSLSIPAVKWAVKNNRGDILESVWLRANCPEARKIALRYYLRLETSSPDLFIDEIREIARDADNRVKEIEEVASEFERHRRK